jgi:hypothetical protein
VVNGGLFQGCGEGLHAAGTGLSLVGGRFEVCHIGMRLGADPAGKNWVLTRSSFSGISMEADDTALLCHVVDDCTFSAIGHHGTTNAPSGASQIGVELSAGNSVFSGCKMEGAYQHAAWQLDKVPGNTPPRHTLIGCLGFNGYPGLPVWLGFPTPAAPLPTVVLMNCNN